MSSPVRIVPRQDIDPAVWNRFVDAEPNAWLWHRHEFQEVLATWPGRADISFALQDPGGDLLAVVPLHAVSRRIGGLIPATLLDSFGGPAVASGLGERHRVRLLRMVEDHFRARLARLGGVAARIGLAPLAPALRGEDCPRVSPLVFLDAENQPSQTWMLDLRVGADALWKGFEGRARTAIRKAENSGVNVAPAGEADLADYYRLHRETYARTGAPPHPFAYFEQIWERILKPGRARIWLAKRGSELLAAENFALYKEGALYWTGAATRSGLELSANSLIQWRAMQWMTENAYQWYETGEAFPAARAGKLKGLNAFKQSFGGSLHPIFRSRLQTSLLRERIYKAYLTLRT